MGARFYDPDLGRFLQVDPAREYFNSYSYVGNNPVMGVDPTGNGTEATFDFPYGGNPVSEESVREFGLFLNGIRNGGRNFFQGMVEARAYDVSRGSGYTSPLMDTRHRPRPFFETYQPSELREISFTYISNNFTGFEISVKKVHMQNNEKEWFGALNFAAGSPGWSLAFNRGSIKSTLPGVDGSGPFSRSDIAGISASWNIDLLGFGFGQELYNTKALSENKGGFRFTFSPVGASVSVGYTLPITGLFEKFQVDFSKTE